MEPSFVRSAMSLADYRSYCDIGSRDLMRRAGLFKTGSVFPNLAYSRPGDFKRPRLPILFGRWELPNLIARTRFP